ncbi:hypothetical protein [Pseudomonas sp. S1_F04]
MDFLNFVQAGVEKSNKCLAAIAEVDGIFESVNADLKRYAAGELKLVRSVSGKAQIESIVDKISGVESSYLRNDRICLKLKSNNTELSMDVAGWKQRATGYPCVLKFDGQELSCGTAALLVDGLSEFLASVGFGNAVNNLTKKLLESDVQKKARTSNTDQSTHLSLVNKTAAKPAAWAAAKPAAAKAVAKSGASRTTAKPAAAKAAKKPGVPKAAAKPAIAKVAAKPGAAKAAAKPDDPKVVAKPAAAKTTAKSATPKAVKPAVAKPAAKPAAPKAGASAAESTPNKTSREYQQNGAGDMSS